MQFGSDTHTQNKVTCCENEESKDSGLCGLWGVGELSDVSLKDIPCRKVLSAWDELELYAKLLDLVLVQKCGQNHIYCEVS